MVLKVVQLLDLIDSDEMPDEELKKLLFTFECKTVLGEESDVQYFLREKAVQFDKMALSRTYLVFSSYHDKPYICGYFSIAIKSLIIPKRVFAKLSNSLKRRLMGMGQKTEQANYECKGYLLGQLGKNYSETAKTAGMISGDDLLELAYDKIRESHRMVGGRVLHLECDDIPKLKDFYSRNGFAELENYESKNGLRLFVKTMDKVLKHS